MSDLGRLLIALGLLLAAVGVAVLLLGKSGLPIGRLPGDFSWRGRNSTVYFPLGHVHPAQRGAVAGVLHPVASAQIARQSHGFCSMARLRAGRKG